jgi:phosphoglycerol transferase MdoB-like AlkP superfamily enzyme
MKKKMFKQGDTAKDFEFKKEEQHEIPSIYLIPIIGILFLPILFFSSRVSMFGKSIAFLIQFLLACLIYIILFAYLGFCSGG